jgi:hypothetical protein
VWTLLGSSEREPATREQFHVPQVLSTQRGRELSRVPYRGLGALNQRSDQSDADIVPSPGVVAAIDARHGATILNQRTALGLTSRPAHFRPRAGREWEGMTVNWRRKRFTTGGLGEIERLNAEKKNRCKSLPHSGLLSRGDWI